MLQYINPFPNMLMKKKQKTKKTDRIPSFHKNTTAVDKLTHFIEWVKDLKYIPLFI